MILANQYAAISADELRHAVQAGQSTHAAFLSAKTSTRRLAETLAALANANGGLVLLGVTASGGFQQDVDVQALRDLISTASLLTEPPLILPSPQTMVHPHLDRLGERAVETGQGVIVVVQVPPGLPHVYHVNGAYLTRQGAQNQPLDTARLRQLLLERGDRGYEEMAMPDATLEDLNPRRIERYLTRIGAAPDADAVQMLASRGCVTFVREEAENATEDVETPVSRRAVPTVAGLLLFGRNPQRFLRSAELICVRYMGSSMSDEFVRQEIVGTLPEQIQQAETFITTNMRRGMRITGMARQETTEYPLAVVREAIVNAIAHRDYSQHGEGIRLIMYSDRMEVYSPGRLPGHVTLDNLVDERYSRNEALVAVLTDLGYIERLGYGIDRMIATMQQAGLKAPIFEETSAGFKVTLYSAGVDLVSPQPAQQPWGHAFLNERQESALAFVQQNGRITNSDYQELVPDVSAETIRRDLADLVDKNLLLRIGSKRATYYILK
ncbi:MAG: putative DNA binding domain-containing protein [Caldilineaceae bacterium]|nr:putative DNA binding domain-containing protein [Caldilineaceae bacterium]